MPRISVIIPSYNHARFIEEAIASVLDQSYFDIELIVVDDGSSDGSSDLIRKALSKASISRAILIEQENTGTAGAIERGVSESRGELLAVLNSDDRYSPHRFERLLSEAPDEGDFLVFSKARMIDAAGFSLPESSYVVEGYRQGLYEASRCPTVGFALLRNNFAASSGNALFTRSLYEKIGGFSPYQLASDWDFLLRSLLEIEPIFVDEPLFDYRTHDTNARAGITFANATEEGRTIINAYFAAASSGVTKNSLAPCQRNWPVYFDLFVSRYHPWFGSGPIRDWMDDPPSALPDQDAITRWKSWGGAVDFERVDDCDYLAADDYSPGEHVALALAREVVMAKAHPLEDEEGPGESTWLEVFRRASPGRPEFVRDSWHFQLDRSPIPSPDNLGLQQGRVDRTKQALRTAFTSVFPRSLKRRLREMVLLMRSGLFDAGYYRKESGQKGNSLMLCWHYLQQKGVSGFSPHPLFDREFYLRMNPGLIEAEVNPLIHYLDYGGKEGRGAHPLFDSAFYLHTYPDVAAFGMNPLSHYVNHGAEEGRIPHIRFDPEFYTEEYDVGDQLPIWHYLEEGQKKGHAINRRHRMRQQLEAMEAEEGPWPTRFDETILRRKIRVSGCFDESTYSTVLARNYSDSHIHDPIRNFLELGAVEGIPLCSFERMEAKLETLDVDDAAQPELAYLKEKFSQPVDASVAVYVSSLGNAFFREIAELLAHAFRQTGAHVQLVDEKQSPPTADSHIVVAPHEFFLLGRGPQRLRMDFLSRCSIWIAEQPGSEFFSICLWFARFARGILDINPLTALFWGELGFRARALPLGYVDGFDTYRDQQSIESPAIRAGQSREFHGYSGGVDDAWAERPLDIFYNAVLTARRDNFVARNSYFFSELRCAFFMPTAQRPLSPKVASALSGGDATALGQRAKVQLNIHRGDFSYFEWHRLVVRGIWQKSVVVTEPCLPVPGLLADEHYLEAELEDMPGLLDWLLRTPEGQTKAEEIRKNAFEELVSRYDLRSMASAFLAEDMKWLR